MTLVRFSPLSASALSPLRCARPPWLLPLRRWLTAAVTASNRFALGCGVLMLDYLATVEFNTEIEQRCLIIWCEALVAEAEAIGATLAVVKASRQRSPNATPSGKQSSSLIKPDHALSKNSTPLPRVDCTIERSSSSIGFGV